MKHVHYVSFKENKVDVCGIVRFLKTPVPEHHDLICNLYK